MFSVSSLDYNNTLSSEISVIEFYNEQNTVMIFFTVQLSLFT